MRNFKLLILIILFFNNKIYSVTHPITSNSNNTFAPASITIASGDILSFTNSGGSHSVQWLTGPVGFILPATSAALGPVAITYTLTIEGTYTYQCGVHGESMLGTITVTTALPIKLYSFMVEPDHKGTKLKWVTASETDVDHFELERSNEVLKFNEIARIAVFGNSTENRSYTFNDEYAFNGVNYYRLKTVNLDKSISFSPIIVITIFSETSLNIYPNPSSEVLSLTWNDMDSHRFLLNIYDLNGKSVEIPIEIISKTHSPSLFDLNVSKYNTGKYFATLTNSKGIKQQFPFIVNR